MAAGEPTIDGNPEVIVLGVDTGLMTLGLAAVSVWPMLSVKSFCAHTFVDSKRDMSSTERTLDASYQAAVALRDFWPGNVVAVAAEGISMPQRIDSRSVLKIGIGWGIVACFAATKGVPIFQRFPATLKKFVTGSASASKTEVQEAITATYNISFSDLPKKAREHAADAIAAALCVAAQEKYVTMATRMLQNRERTEVAHHV